MDLIKHHYHKLVEAGLLSTHSILSTATNNIHQDLRQVHREQSNQQTLLTATDKVTAHAVYTCTDEAQISDWLTVT